MSAESKIKERIKNAGIALLAMQRHSWEQGLAMQAFLETEDMDTVVRLAVEAVYRAMPDGRAATIGVTDAVTDPCSVGEALLAACDMTQSAFLIDGEKKLRKWALEDSPCNREGTRYHLNTGHEFWADSMYMLPPYLAAMGKCYEAWVQFAGYWNALYDIKAGLIVHKWDDDLREWSDPLHWGIGNGWCLMAIARLIGIMAKDKDNHEIIVKLSERGRMLLERVLSFRDDNGRLHDILDDKDSFEETGISQMCAYTIYRGISDGWLIRHAGDRERLMDAADSLRIQAEDKQDEFGFIHDVCGAPYFDRPGMAPEQQAIFMMMEHWYMKVKEDENVQ